MLDIENPKIEYNNQDAELNAEIDKHLAILPLSNPEMINAIIEARDKEALQRQFEAFNMTQSKKNALRIIKLNDLLDKVEDQAIERFEKRPDQVSNKELLEYMQVVANQIDRSQKYVDNLDDKPMISIKNQKNELNVNIGTDLDRDSKEHVVDAIKELLKQLKDSNNTQNNIDVSIDIPSQQSDISYNLLADPEESDQ